jgi:hypothetical protein
MSSRSCIVAVDHAVRRTAVKPLVPLLLALMIGAGAAAQPAGPTIGPNNEAPSRSLWHLLTPEQREQLWRMLTPEQRADLWRGLEPRDRREMRERAGPGEAGGPPSSARRVDPGDGSPRLMMTPDERQRMREQIREAHRLRRERLDVERARRPE